MKSHSNTRTCAKFGQDQKGMTAVIMSLVLVPILMMVSFAVDLSRQQAANRHLKAAIDAASLTGARALEDASLSDGQITQMAKDVFVANMQGAHGDVACVDATIGIDRARGRVTVASDCQLPTLFGSVFWRESVGVKSSSTAQAALTKLDLALMLDVSGSMNGQKLADLKTAAKDAAAKLITARTGDRVRISFNTYSTSVNAGAYAKDVIEDWKPGDSTCVSERGGAAKWKDDKPGFNKWLGKSAGWCPGSSVLPLTNNLTTFNAAIDSLNAGGMTAGHLGVAWAWYLISPDWDTVWPVTSKPRTYTEPNSKKAVILMTDGIFNIQYEGAQGSSNVQAKKLCSEMRKQGVLVYAVAFQAPAGAKLTLEDCAGDPKRFFDAQNGDELKRAYDAIASQLSNLALVD